MLVKGATGIIPFNKCLYMMNSTFTIFMYFHDNRVSSLNWYKDGKMEVAALNVSFNDVAYISSLLKYHERQHMKNINHRPFCCLSCVLFCVFCAKSSSVWQHYAIKLLNRWPAVGGLHRQSRSLVDYPHEGPVISKMFPYNTSTLILCIIYPLRL